MGGARYQHGRHAGPDEGAVPVDTRGPKAFSPQDRDPDLPEHGGVADRQGVRVARAESDRDLGLRIISRRHRNCSPHDRRRTWPGLLGMAENRFIFTANTDEPDPAADFDIVIEKSRELKVDTLQINAFGFGWQNASIVVTRN